MSQLLNSAGGSAGDPILAGLGFEWIMGASSFDIATIDEAWIDTASGFPGTSSVKSSLSPAASVLTAGTSGTYDDTTKAWAIGSTTGLSAGDYYYLSHASITAGYFKIASIVDGTHVTITNNPLNGLGNKTAISYQVAWRYAGTAGTSPSVSSSGGQQNVYKFQADDGSTDSQLSDSNYIRNAPSGSSYIAIGGGSYTGATVSTATPSLDILAGWTNRGGVSHVEIANHSVQGVATIKFGDNSITERTIAQALSDDLLLTGSDGMKYCQFKLKSKSGGVAVSLDADVNLDTSGPQVSFTFAGR
jgi:hypothetical protein